MAEQLELELDTPYLEWKEDPNPMVRAFGKGPKGRKCKDCEHLFYKQFNNRYYKCEYRGSIGPSTDHRVRWNACAKFKEVEQRAPKRKHENFKGVKGF